MTAKEILLKHRLNYSELKKSGVSYISDVWLTEKFAVKIYKHNKEGYDRERRFYERVAPPYAPGMVALGDDYIVLERIYGASIYRSWHRMKKEDRERYVRQISAIANDLTSYSAEGFFETPPPQSWEKHITGKIFSLCSELQATGKIPPDLCSSVINFAKENKKSLIPCTYNLCYSDLHYDNLLADSNGKVWLLDYESLCQAPKDFILGVFDRMSRNPFIPSGMNEVSDKDMKLIEMMEKFTPELFSYPGTNKRVAMYSIIHELELLLYYPNDPLAIKCIEECLI